MKKTISFKTGRDEFRVKNFLLDYDSPQKFGAAQGNGCCRCGQPSVGYLVWRTLLMLFVVSYQVADLATQESQETLELYYTKLTHWSFLVLTIHLVLLWVISIVHYRKMQTDVASGWYSIKEGCVTQLRSSGRVYSGMPVLYKIEWVVYNVTNSTAPIVTLLYWLVVWSPAASLQFGSVMTHAVNTLITITDLFIMAMPIRLLHFWHTQLYALIYGLFTVVYWAAGGRGYRGVTYIYATLNWDLNPTLAVGWLVGLILVAVPLMHLTNFLLYQLRLCIYSGCCGNKKRVGDGMKMGEDNEGYSEDRKEVV